MPITCTREFQRRIERARANGSRVAKVLIPRINSSKVGEALTRGKWSTKRIKKRNGTYNSKVYQTVGDTVTWSTPSTFVDVVLRDWKEHDSATCPVFTESEIEDFEGYFASDSVLHIKRGRSAKFIEECASALSGFNGGGHTMNLRVYSEYYTKVFPTSSVVAAVADDGTIQAVGFIVNEVLVENYYRRLQYSASWIGIYALTDAGFCKLRNYARSIGLQLVTDARTKLNSVIHYDKVLGELRGKNLDLDKESMMFWYIRVPLKYSASYSGGYPQLECLYSITCNEDHLLYATDCPLSNCQVGHLTNSGRLLMTKHICPICGLLSASRYTRDVCHSCTSSMYNTCFGVVSSGRKRKVKGLGTVPSYFFDDGKLKDAAKAMIMLKKFTT